MEEFSAWLRNMVCFLCFFQVFLHLTPKEQYRKYLKFFGDLLLVLLVIRPVAALAGKGSELEQILRTQSLKGEYSEMEMHMEGMEELKNEVVGKAFRQEVERQIQKIPKAYGFSVLSFTVEYDENGKPEGLSMDLYYDGGTEKGDLLEEIREELTEVYGISKSRIEISTEGETD